MSLTNEIQIHESKKCYVLRNPGKQHVSKTTLEANNYHTTEQQQLTFMKGLKTVEDPEMPPSGCFPLNPYILSSEVEVIMNKSTKADLCN